MKHSLTWHVNPQTDSVSLDVPTEGDTHYQLYRDGEYQIYRDGEDSIAGIPIPVATIYRIAHKIKCPTAMLGEETHHRYQLLYRSNIIGEYYELANAQKAAVGEYIKEQTRETGMFVDVEIIGPKHESVR